MCFSFAPILTKEAAKPAPAPRILVRKIFPTDQLVISFDPGLVMKLSNINFLKMKATFNSCPWGIMRYCYHRVIVIGRTVVV